MKKGVCVGRADANLINARLNKLKEQLRYVMQFLQYSKIPINKPTVEDFLYRRYSDVFSFFTEVTDAEDAEQFFKYLNQSAEENQREALENHTFLVSIGEYKATGFMEGLNLHNFETCRKETIIPNFTKWCKSIGVNDYPFVKFDISQSFKKRSPVCWMVETLLYFTLIPVFVLPFKSQIKCTSFHANKQINDPLFCCTFN